MPKALSRTARDVLQPVGRAPGVWGWIAVILPFLPSVVVGTVALILTPVLVGTLFFALAICATLIVLFGNAALKANRTLIATEEVPSPHLVFWEGEVKEASWISSDAELPGFTSTASASVVSAPTRVAVGRVLRFGRVLVVNDPRDDRIGEEARSVSARIMFLGTSHQLTVDGRWAKTPQAPDRSFYSGDLNVPIDIPANSRAEALDVVVQDPIDDYSAGSEDARHEPYALPDDRYKIVVAIRGTNTPRQTMGYELSRTEDGSIRLLREDLVELYED